MLSNVYGIGLTGLEGFIVSCETDVGNGLPQTVLIGSLSPELKEAAARVRTAIKNSGFYLKPRKLIINLSPADRKKEGAAYDLPIAVSVLVSYGIIAGEKIRDCVFAGELSLGGGVLPVRGSLSLVIAAKKAGFKKVFLPAENAAEGAVIEGIKCYGISKLKDLTKICGQEEEIQAAVYREKDEYKIPDRDFKDIAGQEMQKRATIIAVGGRHNLLYIGPAGTGKSMLASAIPGIMPEMSMEERLEVSQIYSICKDMREDFSLLRERPFRSPHHTLTPAALFGGGIRPKPGEISLADKGVLFLDELAEFRRDTLEVLRQPMEEGCIRISKAGGFCTFPADFMLVAATNPCKCGFYPDRSRCACDIRSVRKYMEKISRPLLDRIDICVETKILKYEELNEKSGGESSESIRKKVEEVRRIQQNRFKNTDIHFNARMDKNMIEQFCRLKKEDEEFLSEIYAKKNMTMRGLHKVLKVARTIADFEKSEEITLPHLCESLNYTGSKIIWERGTYERG